MSEATQNSLVPIGDDGFEAAAAEGAERILKGDLLKFSDGHWLVGREALLIKQDLRLVAMAGRRGEVNAVFGLTANRLPPAARREMIPLDPRFGRVRWKTCQPFQRGRALPQSTMSS